MASSSVFGNGCRVLMAKAKTAASATVSTTTAAAATKAPSGIMKVVTVSPALAKFIGASESSRPAAVKKIWDYAKSNNLQNPENKREIVCDDKLKTLFEGKSTVDFGGIAKMLSNHFPKAA